MRYKMVSKFSLLAGSAAAALTVTTPAFAQDAPMAEEPMAEETSTDDQAAGVTTQEAVMEEAAAEGDDVVVTGTLIRNPNLESSTPVNVTNSDAIELKQSNVAEEVLRELPGVVPSVGANINNGNAGLSFVDLRGLGPNRNIVLLDGNRVVPANLAGLFDLNNVPLALIERVDALTGAAVTTYGADAITGVVNFITRKDFAGVEIAASEQITELGDGNFMRVDLTLGANFDDGRGNAVLSVGYQESDPVYQGARDFSVFQVNSYSGNQSGSGTAVPSRFSGLRPLNTATCLPTTTPTGNGGVKQVDWRDGATCAGGGVGTYSLFNFNPYNLFQTPFTRYNVFGQAHYEVSDAVEVYARGLFSKNTVKTEIAPSGSFGGNVTVNLNNPFLPATLRNQFCAFNVAPTDPTTGLPTGYTPRFTQAECDAAALATGPSDPRYRTVTTALTRRTPEIGPRTSDFTTTVFDTRVGLRGPLTSTVDWDISGAYGESENNQTVGNYTLQSRWREGSLVNLVGGVPTCQSGNPNCVPIDIFGPEGSITPEMGEFLSDSSTTIIRTSLGQLRGLLTGDVGYTLPWAAQPIGFAVGTEFRKYKASQAADSLAKTPGELGGLGGANPDINGGYSVYEGYGELIMPIVEGKPGFESLTLEAGGRYSKYEIDGGGGNNTWTWKAGGSWEPGYGVKIRGNYSRAVRAPNIGELFSPESVGLTNLAIDPCAGAGPLTNADLRAICIAQGAPAGTIGSILQPSSAQVNVVGGGNVNLKPEKANTWTLGVVFQPEFLRRFTVSVDYYNIRVKDVIGTALPGDLINACFGNITAASASDPACTIIRRNPMTGGLDGDPATTPGLYNTTNNLGELFTDGVDLIANYKTSVGFGDLALSFVGNWTRNSEFNANVDSESGFFRECAGYYSVNCSFTGSMQPKLQFSQRTTLSMGKVDLSLLWRWIDSMKFEPWQLAVDTEAAEAANRDADGDLLPIDLSRIGQPGFQGCPNYETTDEGFCMVEEEFRKINAEHYFDLTARFNATDNMTFTFTVQNLFDNKPKIVGNTIGSTTFNSGNLFPATYDALGRRYAVSAKLKF